MVTAVREIQSAVKAIKLGAYEYIIKPFVVEEVVNIINRALEKRSLVKELTYLRDELQGSAFREDHRRRREDETDLRAHFKDRGQ